MDLQKLTQTKTKTNIVQKVFRILLGVTLIFAGTTHLTTARKDFQAQVPKWVPLDADLVVVLSGIVEIVLGACLIVTSKYRALVGWLGAGFFVAVFPGNISQYVNRIDAFGLDTDRARGIRLLFQPLLVAWALWSTGAWQTRHLLTSEHPTNTPEDQVPQ